MSEEQILNKLDNIQKDQNISSSLSNASFGLALIAVAISIVQNTARLDIIIMSGIIGIIGSVALIRYIIKWRDYKRG